VARLIPKNDKESITNVHIKDRGDGSYRCSYVSGASGLFSLEVTLDQKHISGSPFKVVVEPSTILSRLNLMFFR
jgi:hypothetical protein